MSDKRNQANPRRVFPSWLKALYVATCYGGQTGRKWRVYRSGAVWRIQRTAKRYVHDFSTEANRSHVQRWRRFKAMLGERP